MIDSLIHTLGVIVGNIFVWGLLIVFIYWFLKEMKEAINLWK